MSLKEEITDLILSEHVDFESGMHSLLDWCGLEQRLYKVYVCSALEKDQKMLVNYFRDSLSIPPLSTHDPIGAVLSELYGRTPAYVVDLCELCLDSKGLVEEFVYHQLSVKPPDPSKVISRLLKEASDCIQDFSSVNNFQYCFPIIVYGLSLKMAAQSLPIGANRRLLYVGYLSSNLQHKIRSHLINVSAGS